VPRTREENLQRLEEIKAAIVEMYEEPDAQTLIGMISTEVESHGDNQRDIEAALDYFKAEHITEPYGIYRVSNTFDSLGAFAKEYAYTIDEAYEKSQEMRHLITEMILDPLYQDQCGIGNVRDTGDEHEDSTWEHAAIVAKESGDMTLAAGYVAYEAVIIEKLVESGETPEDEKWEREKLFKPEITVDTGTILVQKSNLL